MFSLGLQVSTASPLTYSAQEPHKVAAGALLFILHTLYAYDCTPHCNTKPITESEDNAVVGLISGGDDSACRGSEADRLMC